MEENKYQIHLQFEAGVWKHYKHCGGDEMVESVGELKTAINVYGIRVYKIERPRRLLVYQTVRLDSEWVDEWGKKTAVEMVHDGR